MRVTHESPRAMTVEANGRRMFQWCAALCACHALVFLLPSVVRLGFLASAGVLVASLAAYAGLLIATRGPFAEKVTVTFDGAKHRVVVEYLYPMDKKKLVTVSFDDFTQFEFSAPLDYGFMRLRLKTGKAFLLFRIGARDDYRPLQQLDMVTRKQLVAVVKKPQGVSAE